MTHFTHHAGAALCGDQRPGEALTKDIAKVTCRRCLKRLEQIQRKREKKVL